MSIDPKFVELTADVLEIFLQNTSLNIIIKYLTTAESESVLIQTVTTASPTNGTTMYVGEITIDGTITKQSNNGQINHGSRSEGSI